MKPNKLSVRDVLVAARKTLTNLKHWTQRYYAKDENGDYVEANNPHAVCWCSIGAIMLAAKTDYMWDDDSIIARAQRSLEEQIGGSSITTWNDQLASHQDVLNAFDAAIEELTA
jgi:hypothetical protein